MPRITIYLRLITSGRITNPYIEDFVNGLNRIPNTHVVNPPHKNPLLSILPIKQWGDVFIFNWYENIVDNKYGDLQAVIAIFYIILLKLCRKKIVWVLHNKLSHSKRRIGIKKMMFGYIIRQAHLIITHAQEGIELIRRDYPFALHKIHFLHHPTKDRIELSTIGQPIQYDLLIWGTISPYKGIVEFLTFAQKHCPQIKICIAGVCPSESLKEKIMALKTDNTTFIHSGISFEQLGKLSASSRFVLAPYHADSVLSSAMLMDSLSFGAKVIGPNVGSFADYTKEKSLKVFTFNHYSEIPNLIKEHGDETISVEQYHQFLNSHNWDSFCSTLMKLI